MSELGGTQPLVAQTWDIEERLKRIEQILQEHIDYFIGHTIKKGHHERFNESTTLQRYTIWEDSNKIRKLYEELVYLNPADTSQTLGKTVTYYRPDGTIRRQLVFYDFDYGSGVTGLQDEFSVREGEEAFEQL